ncbi:MAG: prephenate dehydrogenase/arogenate dehydrogenase family protein [Desulfovibrio sp.]|jgi:prephenate dehydrogenase|nr:prephenate dehydrogenase/arogenate dehydrogenase family protein [Desulfovibrio sp.]
MGVSEISPKKSRLGGKQNKTVIVGARGRMGRMLLGRAAERGLNASGADIPLVPQTLAPACAGARLAIVCVPAAVFKTTLTAVCPHLPQDAVLCDITSVKEQPLRQMEAVWPGYVVGTHPLFGPSPMPGDKLSVALVPGVKAGPREKTLVGDFFRALGCRVFETTAGEHDSAMARIQGMNFITTLAYFALLADRKDILPFLTPSFRRRLDAARKMLTEDAELFTGIFNANPHSLEAVRQYRHMLNLAAGGEIELLCGRAQWWWKDAAKRHSSS